MFYKFLSSLPLSTLSSLPLSTLSSLPLSTLSSLPLFDRRGDEFGEKAVILVLVVLAGVAAFAAFGGKVVELINQATAGM